jgi:hypothetical protein
VKKRKRARIVLTELDEVVKVLVRNKGQICLLVTRAQAGSRLEFELAASNCLTKVL